MFHLGMQLIGWHMDSWYCIYTKANYEDPLCRRLGDFSDIEVLNPKLKRKKYVRGKLQDVVEEFFPCYIFARFDLPQYYHMIRYTRGVRRIVGDSQGKPNSVDETLIDVIKSRIIGGYICIEENRLTKGDEVLIKGGPFDGFAGLFIEELKPRERVLVLLNTLNYQAKIEIFKDFVVKACPAVSI
jgi:transcription antitermination factor NusG